MQRIDRTPFFAYNSSMSEKKRENTIRFVLKILLPIACVAWIAFIFSNSLKTGAQSSAQSSTAVAVVQKVAQVVAPSSKIATATGEDYDILHAVVRKLAHFTEFAGLGALLCWCYFAYTSRYKWAWLPAVGVLLVPVIDELLQTLTNARACSVVDMCIDAGGGAVGLLLAWVVVLIIWKIWGKSKSNEAPMYENTEK